MQDYKEHVKDLLSEFYEKIELRYMKKADTYGEPTGYYDYDMFLGGLHKSELTVLAGRHSMGKTSFAVNIMNNLILKSGIPVMYVSYEMDRNILVSRFLIAEAEIEAKKVYNACMTEKNWQQLAITMNKFAQAADDGLINIKSGCTLDYKTLFDDIREFVMYNQDAVIIVDYFQLIKPEREEDKISQMSSMAAAFKRLAIELDVPIILISEVNKKCESRTNKRPILGDLFECDALAQHADNVIFIYRDDYYQNKDNDDYDSDNSVTTMPREAEIIIAKQKNGATGHFKLLFLPTIFKFKNPIKTDTF